MQSVSGGDIYCIDTEARRALHYAENFKFRHVPFSEPFGSLDYLVAIRHCVSKGGKIIIVDSMSHEHEGVGGCLDFQEKEVDRLAGNDYAKRERVKMLAWQKPKAARRQLLNGITQLEASMIFCFRAKEKTKPIKTGGKTEIIQMGFQAIAGEELAFEMTLNCLLLPNSGGVPSWESDNMGERSAMKLPLQFRKLFAELAGHPLDEETGRRLAEWARGGKAEKPAQSAIAIPREIGDWIAMAPSSSALADWANSEQQKKKRAALDPKVRAAVRAAIEKRADELKRTEAEDKPKPREPGSDDGASELQAGDIFDK